MRHRQITGGSSISNLARAFQPSCVLIAGAELDVFTLLGRRPMTANGLARRIRGDRRGTAVLLDALAALGLLQKTRGENPVYRVPAAVARELAETGPKCMLGMVRHLGNCLRNWARLADVVLRGRPAPRYASVRGAAGDLASFIRAMNEVSKPMAEPLIDCLGPLKFNVLLDLGGASGTWTIPFLQRNRRARGIIFDQPDVIPMARHRMRQAGLADRVKLVPGDYNRDRLPPGFDLAWVSAIVHQNSREQNRRMLANVRAAMIPGGRVLIRDILVDSSRTRPAAAALFAVNMLVATAGGGTFTFGELRDDLTAAGFRRVTCLHRGQGMDSVVCATKP